MNWTLWITLYIVIGVVCYIAAAVFDELDTRKEGRQMDLDKYLNLTFIIPLWPPCLLIALLAGCVIGMMLLCKTIANCIEIYTKKPVDSYACPTVEDIDKDANKIK